MTGITAASSGGPVLPVPVAVRRVATVVGPSGFQRSFLAEYQKVLDNVATGCCVRELRGPGAAS